MWQFLNRTWDCLTSLPPCFYVCSTWKVKFLPFFLITLVCSHPSGIILEDNFLAQNLTMFPRRPVTNLPDSTLSLIVFSPHTYINPKALTQAVFMSWHQYKVRTSLSSSPILYNPHTEEYIHPLSVTPVDKYSASTWLTCDKPRHKTRDASHSLVTSNAPAHVFIHKHSQWIEVTVTVVHLQGGNSPSSDDVWMQRTQSEE